ncbi:MAG: pentapeptide repeat-containing protein [Acidimicrobiaceae bacterium]|nr:pentapeptide repeat-containing protein [Acidimicrobiaceae bacterium]MYE09859.1 pentapeptide repeat-containing protein [Acidimicrobiaceae bacterium]MYI36951.1 pentapeptide repeat-containing protein [Acidimicrobiaceae bacterium]
MEDRREAEETNSEQSEKQPDSSDSKKVNSWKKGWYWAAFVLYVVAYVAGSAWLWNDIRTEDESISETLRNLTLVGGAVAGVFIAVWRSISASDQAAATEAQANAAKITAAAETASLEANTARTNQIAKQNEIARQHADAAVDQVEASKEIAKDQNKIAERRVKAARDQITASKDIAKDQNEIAKRRAETAEQQLVVSTGVADKQVQAAEAQLAAGNAQVAAAIQERRTAREYGDAAREGAQDARYYQGVEALGHDEISIRLAGVCELEALFHENFDRYGVRVVKLLCAFARNPPRLNTRTEIYSPLREDVQTIVSFIGREVQETFQAVGHDQKCEINLRGAALPYADMRGADMSDVDFSEAILIEADFLGADLTGAKFHGANILGAKVTDATFENDQLENAENSEFVYGLEVPSSSE